MSTYAAAPRAYQQSSVLTAPPARLVLMLYDGLGRFLLQAGQALREGDLERANNRLQRGEAIIDELLATLDTSAGELAERLGAIYVWSRAHLNEARLERDPEKIERVRGLLGELRDAWAEISA